MTDQPGYTRILNSALQDDHLSFEARGALTYLLSKPALWTVQIADLQRAGKCGRDRVYRILKELRDAGYLTRQRTRQPDGTFVWGDYQLTSKPYPAGPDTEKPDMDKPQQQAMQPFTENPDVEPLPCYPDTDKPDTENTEILETKDGYKQKKDRAPRKSADAPHTNGIEPTTHQAIMRAYSDALGYPIPDGASAGAAAKKLISRGYTAEQVAECYRDEKARDFWKGKHLSLQSLAKCIGAWAQARQKKAEQRTPEGWIDAKDLKYK